jgi:hypothetical protein
MLMAASSGLGWMRFRVASLAAGLLKGCDLLKALGTVALVTLQTLLQGSDVAGG